MLLPKLLNLGNFQQKYKIVCSDKKMTKLLPIFFDKNIIIKQNLILNG